jgi:hypothetical protein
VEKRGYDNQKKFYKTHQWHLKWPKKCRYLAKYQWKISLIRKCTLLITTVGYGFKSDLKLSEKNEKTSDLISSNAAILIATDSGVKA